MKYRIVCLLLILGFIACASPSKRLQEKIEHTLRRYVQENCLIDEPCIVRLEQLTDLLWDKAYYFPSNVEPEEVQKVLGMPYSSRSRYYSRSLFFVKDGQVVASAEREIPKVDESIEIGEFDFEWSASEQNFSVYERDSTFAVERMRKDDGEYYRLRCINCK